MLTHYHIVPVIKMIISLSANNTKNHNYCSTQDTGNHALNDAIFPKRPLRAKIPSRQNAIRGAPRPLEALHQTTDGFMENPN